MKDKIIMIIFVVILGFVSAGILTGMKYLTDDRIEKNEELKLKETILQAFDVDYNENNIEESFDTNLELFEKENTTFYRSIKGEIGFEFSGAGLWGPIEGFITLNEDLETIKGIQIVAQEETPGLGGVVGEVDYLAQYKGKKVVPRLVLIKNSSGDNAENEVDSITGATMTSDAFEELLNNDIKKHKEILVK